MKRKSFLVFVFLALALAWGCAQDPGAKPIITGDDTPSEITDPTNNPVLATLITGEGLKFYDGASVWKWRDGTGQRARSRVYSNATVLYALDEYGETSSSKNIVTEPDRIRIITNPAASPSVWIRADLRADEINLGDSEVWIVETISAEEAAALGALPKPYTRIYDNAAEFGSWLDRCYVVDEFTIWGGDIYARREDNGAWVHINGAKTGIHVVVDGGFAIYDFDATARTAVIDGIGVSWATNFFNASKIWLKSGAKWYSHNGYVWDGAVLTEGVSKMWDWRSLQNIVIAAGTHYENGEDVLYFIQCATGYVIRFVPSVNQYVEFVRLYTGDGTTETGLYYRPLLRPSIVGDDFFFIFEGETFRYDFKTGLTSPFGTGISEVVEY